MNPLAKFLLTIGALFGAYKLFGNSSDSSQDAISGIKSENVRNLVKHDRNTNISDLKRSLIQSMNYLIANCNK
jgi:hypothetical protein